MNRQALLDSLLEDIPVFRRITSDLYRWFIINYTWMMTARASLEAYEQVVIEETPWYDISSAIIDELGRGFLVQITIAAALTEVTNMVIGAIWKHQAQRRVEEKVAEARAEIREEVRAEARAEAAKMVAETREQHLLEGRTESNKAWREWLQRRDDAAAAGQLFDEPPPDAVAADNAAGG